MKVFISTDMEGVCGVMLENQVIPGNSKYEISCRLLTEETNAAISGAFEGGATEVRVHDGHLKGFNLDIETLDSRAEYIMGSASPWWKNNLDSSFDALYMVGFHSKAGTSDGVISHTWVHEGITNFWINGISLGEIGAISAIAGYFDVPLALITGDRKAVEEARTISAEVTGVSVKEGLGRNGSRFMHPRKVRPLIEESANNALKRIDKLIPFKIESPIEVKVEYSSVLIAEQKRILPNIEMADSRTVIYRGSDLLEVLAYFYRTGIE